MKEWKDNEYFDESWRNRIKKLASYISRDEVVADLGCGKQWLREYLHPSVDYIPVDYKERTEDTLVCDFNYYEFPNIFVDVSVISGVIEYIEDVSWFVENIINHTAGKIIFSYCSLEMVPNLSQRKKNMWVNGYSSKEMEILFSKSGFELTEKEQIGANLIFVMTRKSKQEFVGVLVHEDNPGNLGDFTQGLAVKEILGQAYRAVYLHRESLHLYRGKRLPVICNGWFSHNPVHPPSEQLAPLYISLHITPNARKWFSMAHMVNHLKTCEPIGCRDHYTRDFLLNIGVAAYFSGCLTYSLGVKLRGQWSSDIKESARSRWVYFVDPPVRYVKKPLMMLSALATAFRYAPLIPKIWPLAAGQESFLRRCLFVVSMIYEYKEIFQEFRGKLVFQTQFLGKNEQKDYKALFSKVQERLLSYYKSCAVVTGRIHVAIPALFSGANIIYIQPEKISTADVQRVSDHLPVFTAIATLSEPDFNRKIINAIRRKKNESNDVDISLSELIERQIETVNMSVKKLHEYSNIY